MAERPDVAAGADGGGKESACPARRGRHARARIQGRLAGWLLWLWARTLRVEVRGEAVARRWPGAPVAVWHGRIHGALFLLRFARRIGVMFSASPDGEAAAAALCRFGIVPVRGSSGKGGRRALEELVRMVSAGEVDRAILTVDGPRGPARRARTGIVRLARKLGRPVIPVSFSATRVWVLRSWDRTVLARPFSRVVAAAGPPVHVEPGEPLEEAAARVGRALDELTERLDREVHGSPVWEPGPGGGDGGPVP